MKMIRLKGKDRDARVKALCSLVEGRRTTLCGCVARQGMEGGARARGAPCV